MNTSTQKIEALLFLAGEAVSYDELARLLKISVEDVQGYLNELEKSLFEHGLAITRTSTHVQLVTSSQVATFLNQYVQDESQPLTAAATETLALVAYRGPISRSEIDAIRGVDSRRMIRQLVQRGLVRRIETKDGIPHYAITEEFLQRLGVTRAEDLPDFDTLSRHERIEALLRDEDAA